jgi:hypothetical protein
MNTSP